MTVAKILPLHDLARRLEDSRRADLKIVHCHGCFDLMHIGHIRHLQAARAMGDLLVVTVTADAYVDKGEGRPAFTEALRAEALAALACVDLVAISPWPTAVEAIRLLRPSYYVKGQAGEDPARRSVRLQQEIATVRELGGDVRFTHEAVFSSTALLNAALPRARRPGLRRDGRFRRREPLPRRNFRLRARHASPVVRDALAALRRLKVLVIGEAIIDEYSYCVPLGKAPKDSVISTKHVRLERQAGGALACANHVAGFCGEVDLVTGLGADDSQEAFIRGRLKPNVSPHFVVREGAPTITKRRYVSEPPLRKLFEVAAMDDTPLPAALEDANARASRFGAARVRPRHRHRLWPRLPRPAHRRSARGPQSIPRGEHPGESREPRLPRDHAVSARRLPVHRRGRGQAGPARPLEPAGGAGRPRCGRASSAPRCP